MKYIMLTAVFLAAAVMVSGCVCPRGKYFFSCHGLGETSQERAERHTRQNKLESQMLVDDIDAFLLTEQPSRLSEYSVR